MRRSELLVVTLTCSVTTFSGLWLVHSRCTATEPHGEAEIAGHRPESVIERGFGVIQHRRHPRRWEVRRHTPERRRALHEEGLGALGEFGRYCPTHGKMIKAQRKSEQLAIEAREREARELASSDALAGEMEAMTELFEQLSTRMEGAREEGCGGRGARREEDENGSVGDEDGPDKSQGAD